VDAIRDAIQNATGYLAEHPSEARYTDSVATAVIDSGLRVRVTGPGSEELATDMVSGVGGSGSAPSPGWMFRASIASCVATLLAMRAAQVGAVVDSIRVDVDSVSDDRGILGMNDAVPAGPLSVRIAVEVSVAGLGSGERDALIQWAVDHCPAVDAVRRAVPVEVTVAAA
jgi:uncharacterized OsmC-like protein